MALTKIDDRGLKTPIDLLDSEKIRFGTGNDLEIFHDGTNSVFRSLSHQCWVETNVGLNIASQAAGEYMAKFIKDGAVELYFDNAKKLETTSTGATVTGNLVFGDNGEVQFGAGTDLRIYHYSVDNNTWINAVNGDLIFARNGTSKIKFDINGNLNHLDTVKATFGTGNDLQIYHNGSHSYIDENGAGILAIRSNGTEVAISTVSGESMGRFINDGGVELYYNNVKHFETIDGGVKVLGTEGGTGNIELFADEGDDDSDKWRIRANTGGDLLIQNYGGGAWDENIKCTANGGVKLYYDDNLKFETTSTGATVSGNQTLTQSGSTTAFLKLHNGDDTDGVKFIYSSSSNAASIQVAESGSGFKIFCGGTNAGNRRFEAYSDTTATVLSYGDENMGVFTPNGAVELYYNNSKKLETASDGAHLVNDLNIYSDSDKDEGHIKIEALGSGVDDDRVWIGVRNSDTSLYNFSVDGHGQVWQAHNHHIGRIKNNSSSPTYLYKTDNYLGIQIYQGIDDGSAAKARTILKTASSDWDDRRVLYYTDSQSSTTAVDYDQDQTISFSGSGRGNFKSAVFAGRVESDESNPNSVYAGSELGFQCWADDATDQTYILARNVADSSFVFYSEVNDEANVEIEADGSARTDGTWSNDNADYAECFEWTDGNGSAEERRGMTVVLDGEKVKLATDSDNKDNIIGVVSPEPVVLGDAAPLGWHGRYKKDVYGSAIRKEQEWLVWKKEYHYEDGVKVLCAQPDPNKPQTLNTCERIRVENIEREKAKGLIPDFAITNNIRYKTYGKDIDKTDYDPSKPYIPRKDRKEWDAIGMVGKLIVRRGQPVGTRWLLMKENIGTDTDGTVLDRYLVR